MMRSRVLQTFKKVLLWREESIVDHAQRTVIAGAPPLLSCSDLLALRRRHLDARRQPLFP
jgi:hypothetical protein